MYMIHIQSMWWMLLNFPIQSSVQISTCAGNVATNSVCNKEGLTARGVVTYKSVWDANDVPTVSAVNNIVPCQGRQHMQGPYPPNRKPQSTLLSADPAPVNIFMGMVILGDSIHLSVSPPQVYMNGPVSHPL